jgi:hypothetical protein
MLAADTPSFLLSRKSHNYSPEDLDSMRKAFMRACGENPLVSETETQRYSLAKAMVSIYQRHLSQTELIAAAIQLVR